MKAASSLLNKIRQAAVTQRRSQLYLWMLTNFDAFTAALADAGRPNWHAIAKTFADENILDLKNQPPTAEGTRLTWFKVRKAVEAKRASAGKPSSRKAAALVTPGPPIPLPSDTIAAKDHADVQHRSRGAFPYDPKPKQDDANLWGPRKK